MTSSSDHCPECLKSGVVATVNGPTCIHSRRQPDGSWWPAKWEAMPLDERIAWIELNRKGTQR